MINIKCWECQKEMASGKYFLIVGNKRSQAFGEVFADEVFCPSCAESYQKSLVWKEKIKRGDLVVIERELGNPIDDKVLEFEERWKKYKVFSETGTTKETEEKINVAWCQAAQKELEPYLQKPEIVEKAFGESGMSFAYFFAKPMQNLGEVNKTVTEFFGGKPVPEIKEQNKNTWGDKKITINNKPLAYQWVDDNHRLINFMAIQDQPWALQSFLRALKIKEKELSKKETPQTNGKSKNNENDPPSKPNLPVKEGRDDSPESSTKFLGMSGGEIIALSIIIGALVLGVVLFWLWKKKKN